MLNGIEEIEGLTPEQIEAINQKASGILSKNEELLDKLSKTKQTNETSLSELEKLRQFKENAEIQMAEDSQNWEESKRLLEEKLPLDRDWETFQVQTGLSRWSV